MSTTLTTEQVEEILALAGAATQLEPRDLMAYEHGGGRLAVIRDGKRDLIADFYGDGADRDYYAALRPQTVSSLATELLALRKRVGELEAWQDISTAPTGRLAPKIMGAWHIGQGTWVQQVVYWGYDDRWYTTWDDTTATPSHWHPLQEDPPLPTPKRQKLAAALRMEGK